MRVIVGDRHGELVGLLTNEREETLVVVRFDGHGLMLKAFHPSKVLPEPLPPPPRDSDLIE